MKILFNKQKKIQITQLQQLNYEYDVYKIKQAKNSIVESQNEQNNLIMLKNIWTNIRFRSILVKILDFSDGGYIDSSPIQKFIS